MNSATSEPNAMAEVEATGASYEADDDGPVLSPEEARRRRAQLQRAASFVDALRDHDAPASGWDMLESMPSWAMCSASELRRLALITGGLYVADALRMCLEAEPVRQLRRLIGKAGLFAVMDSHPVLSDEVLLDALREKPQAFLSRSAALMLAGVAHDDLRAAMVQRLGLPAAMARLPVDDYQGAAAMVEEAARIMEAIQNGRGGGSPNVDRDDVDPGVTDSVSAAAEAALHSSDSFDRG